jgi:hypothetical protein
MTRIRTRTRLIAIAAAAAAALAAAQPAAADSPESVWNIGPPTTFFGFGMGQGCKSTFQAGVYGQFGAWGNYVDGCTAQAKCRHEFCKVTTAYGSLWNNDKSNYWSSRATCASRLRIQNAGGAFGTPGQVVWSRDGSAATVSPSCTVNHRLDDVRYLRLDQWATVQTNGVRAPGDYGARVTSIVELKQADPPLSYWFG